ncbi:MAG: DUF2586 domain-containing protein [Cellvibrionaceae bacterium]
MLGKISVETLNLGQGASPEIEKVTLFIGVGTLNTASILSLNSQSDLDTLLDGEIHKQVKAAQYNGGENWRAYASPIVSGTDWRVTFDESIQAGKIPELVALCSPISTPAEVNALQAEAAAMRNVYGLPFRIVSATPGIDSASQTWSQYETAQTAIQSGVLADRVALVPQTHGNNLGVLMGRLCRHDVSVADSPMRPKTGGVLALGAAPTDIDGVMLSSATIETLDANRLTVIQDYPGYPGLYFGDCNLLDAPAGDFQVIEYGRISDKAERRIRPLAIKRIADRSFNSTPLSMASGKTYFAKVLRDMSKGTTFLDTPMPGDIQPPKKDAIHIFWPDKDTAQVFFKVTPYNSAKEIKNYIALDLSNG